MHALFTSAIAFEPQYAGDVKLELERWGNPVADPMRTRLDRLGMLHFLSITVVPPGLKSAEPEIDDRPFLVLELNADGSDEAAIHALCGAIGSQLAALLKIAGIDAAPETVAKVLLDGSLKIGQAWHTTPGLL